MSDTGVELDRAPVACPDVPTVLANCTANQEPGRSCVAYPKSDNRTGRAGLDGGASRCFNVRAFYSECVGCGVERVVSLPTGSLTQVLLTNNSISSFKITSEGAEIPALVKVLLGENRIESLADIQLPTSVIELNISANRIVDLVFTDGLSNVKTINISANPIRSVNVGAYKGSLTTVFATNLNLSSVAGLGFPYSTKILDLSLNHVANWTEFRPPIDLVSLNASRGSIEQLRRIDFSTAPKLETLNFTDNQIATIEGVKFPPALKHLVLHGSKITKFTIRASDADVLKNLKNFSAASVAIDTAQCEKPAALTAVAFGASTSFNICVLSDADFDRVYSFGPVDMLKPSDMVLPVVVVSVIVATLVTVAFATLMYKRRQLRKLEATRTSRHTAGTRSAVDAATLLDDVRDDPALAQFRVDQQRVSRGRMLAKGGFGVVHLAALDKREVVLKQLLPEKAKDPRAISDFVAEIRLCASLTHPRVVAFLGITWSTLADLAILLEYMPNGDLAQLLKRHRDSAKRAELTWSSGGPTVARSKLELAQDVAEALVYLHSASVVHRDLKAQNVLLSSAWEAKLTDFGVSRALGEQMTAEVGTVSWIAPEVLKGESYDVAADVYSFGVLLAELDTCDKPYAGGIPDSAGGALQEPSNARVALAVVEGRLTPAFRSDCPPRVLALAQQCLRYAASDRPTAVQLRQELQVLAMAPLLSSGTSSASSAELVRSQVV